MAREYQKLARARSDHVEILALNTGHYEIIAPGQKPWYAMEQLILNRAFNATPTNK